MHKASGQWKLGFALALTAATLWGLLPIALKIVLGGMDPYTITWYRFATSGLILGIILARLGKLPATAGFGWRVWTLLGVALAGLLGNYILYLVALNYASPTVNQTVIQISPMFLLLGGLIVFKEPFSRLQWTGFAVLVIGLALFFNRRLPELMTFNRGLGLGVVLLIGAAVVWVAYGLVQKQLLNMLTSQQVLLLLYVAAAVVLLPVARVASVGRLSALELGMLIFCCLNTLVAYGAFAEALQHWEVSRVSAVLSLGPLFTIARDVVD